MIRNIQHSCGNCGKPVNANASRCPHCGVRLEGSVWKDGVNPFEKKPLTSKQKRDTVIILAIPIIGLLAILCIIFL